MLNLDTLSKRLLLLAPGVAATPSRVPGVTFFHRVPSQVPECYLGDPVITFILSGRKRTVAGGLAVEYGAGEFLVVGSRLPGECTVLEVGDKVPFLSVCLTLDFEWLRSLFFELGNAVQVSEKTAESVLFSGNIDEAMLDAISRLIDAAGDEVRAKVLGPLIVKELLSLVALSDKGPQLRLLCESSGTTGRLLRIIEELRRDCKTQLDPESLARESGMSVAVFYRKFRQMTGMSPLQFQKKTRLFRAQSLLVTQKLRVSEAALSVGYEDLSQFSREYKRQFGYSPQKTRSNVWE